jgi:hypothetical protein
MSAPSSEFVIAVGPLGVRQAAALAFGLRFLNLSAPIAML